MAHINQDEYSAIHARIDEISALADQRKAKASDWYVSVSGGAGVAFLSSDELAELNELKLKLPTFAQLRHEAQMRIKQRLASRRGLRAEP